MAQVKELVDMDERSIHQVHHYSCGNILCRPTASSVVWELKVDLLQQNHYHPRDVPRSCS